MDFFSRETRSAYYNFCLQKETYFSTAWHARHSLTCFDPGGKFLPSLHIVYTHISNCMLSLNRKLRIFLKKTIFPFIPHIQSDNDINTVNIFFHHVYILMQVHFVPLKNQVILPGPWLGCLAFIPDRVSKSIADSRLKGPWLRLSHLWVGELQHWHLWSLLYSTGPYCPV